VITVAAFTDAKRAGTCAVWDLATERQECEVALPPTAMAPQAAISADGTRLIVLTTTHDPQTRAPGVRVTGWEIKTGKKLGEVTDPHPLDTVYVTAAPGDAAVLVSRTGRLWSVDYVAGTVAKDIDKLPFQGEVAVYDPVVFSPDGKLFATGAQGAKAETFGVRVYDWPDGKRVRTYVGHTAAVSAMRFTPDGKYLASGSQDTSVFLWDLSKNPGSK
jgi:WD40 repeat protein